MKGNQTKPPKEDTAFDSLWDDGRGKYRPIVFDPRFFYSADKSWGDAARVWAVASSETGESWHIAATVGKREELFFRTKRPIPPREIAAWLYLRGYHADPLYRWRRWFLSSPDYSPPIPGARNEDVPHPGAVYFLRDSDRQQIKIGYSTDVERRVRSIGAMNCGRVELLGHINSPRWYEGLLHQIFSADRVHGEWFRESVDLLSLASES
jgi:hypothetical protein